MCSAIVRHIRDAQGREAAKYQFLLGCRAQVAPLGVGLKATARYHWRCPQSPVASPCNIISKELVNCVVTEEGVEEVITMLPTTVKLSEEKTSNRS